MRVFLDANVLFSAANPGSNIAKLIDLLIQTHQAVTSDLAHEEARRNITLKRHAWSDPFNELMKQIGLAPSVIFPLPVSLNEKDLPLLCAAIHANCSYFVTGDKRDFGHLYTQTIHNTKIIPLLHFAKILTNPPRSD